MLNIKQGQGRRGGKLRAFMLHGPCSERQSTKAKHRIEGRTVQLCAKESSLRILQINSIRNVILWERIERSADYLRLFNFPVDCCRQWKIETRETSHLDKKTTDHFRHVLVQLPARYRQCWCGFCQSSCRDVLFRWEMLQYRLFCNTVHTRCFHLLQHYQ